MSVDAAERSIRLHEALPGLWWGLVVVAATTLADVLVVMAMVLG
ncbi:hypothetical protein [Demequina sp. NBRC 110051]|nr:hypothetical protein [Demequina sp. NBRC 110051]